MHTVCLTTSVLMEHAVHIINLQLEEVTRTEGDKNLSFTICTQKITVLGRLPVLLN